MRKCKGCFSGSYHFPPGASELPWYNGARLHPRETKGFQVITIEDVRAARETVREIVVHTPLLASDRLSQDVGGRIWVKAENTQRAGSFKLRGAYNKMASLTPQE